MTTDPPLHYPVIIVRPSQQPGGTPAPTSLNTGRLDETSVRYGRVVGAKTRWGEFFVRSFENSLVKLDLIWEDEGVDTGRVRNVH